ncbi:NDP-hexose 2,3-dehydratase family protein [Oribacterium sp. NK2B42]|uniref:NDP-hexose 2,3-dehydratase family protein n=1 Tax=Oribacterium sp. NK2B42 TaxID=689781 RepID=UPI001FA766CA|nr:NDP-hexose 2,3-dehydratase family protein [Oribacterium sp. NK2B42]
MYNIHANMSLMQLIESWATTENPFNSTDDILTWIKEKNRDVRVDIRKIPYDYTGDNWHYDQERGEIRNRDGSFFQIKGLQKAEDGRILHEQPIIIQNEIGYLGIICKEFDGVLYFLMQAKIEPGNVNKIQISPTIQATKSNFMQVHGGRVPAFLEYFSNKRNYEIIVDQIQSEQSSRFLRKRNRNIIIVVNEEIEVPDTHRWMTLGQIKQLMRYDNLVNMDTRTVISCIPFSLRDFSYKELSHIRMLFHQEPFYNSVFFGNSGSEINKIYQYMNEVKMLDRSEIRLVDLYSLASWKRKMDEISSEHGAFKVVYCDIEIEGREVRRWQQPLLEAEGQSVFGLIYCVEDNLQKFLIQTKSEVGCFDKIEIGPSVQLEPGENPNASLVDALFTYNYEHNRGIEFDGLFSEEGGRFYQEQNRNVIMKIEKGDLPQPLPEGYFWADFQTLNILIQFNNCLNIQLRNLLSVLDI